MSSIVSRASGIGCPTCSKTGFDPNKDGYLYFLVHSEWEMFQIGITNVPDDRLNRHRKLGWEVLELRGPMDGHLTQQWETAILRMLKARGADLSNANLSGADLMHANLRKTNLTHANLTNANLSNANLAKAKLSKAQLTGANLSKAHLHQANLTNAHMSGANLTGADITGANMTGADLSGATMPDGKVHKKTHA